MRLAALLALSLLSTPALAQAPAPAGPSRTFTAADLFGLEQASGPQVRPDGKAVAYVRLSADLMTDRMRPSIWVADVEGGGQRPVVAGPGAHHMPRWSPDGRRLAYVSTGDGDRPQLYVRWMDTGTTARVAALPESPEALAWSPDGRLIAFTMFVPKEGPRLGAAAAKPEGAKWAEPLKIVDTFRWRTDSEGELKPGFTHIFVVSAEGGAPRQLTFGDVNDGGPLSWTPDGRHLIYSANREQGWERDPNNSEVYEVAVADGSVRALTRRKGPDSEPVVSPDGRLIAYVGYDDRRAAFQNTELYVAERDGSNPRPLTRALDREVSSPRWAADGRSVFVQYVDEAVTKVARVDLSGRVTPVAEGLGGGGLDRPYSGGEFDVAGGTVAYTRADPLRPADLVVLRGGRPVQLTRLNEELFAGKTLGRVEPLAVRAPDGKPVPSWLVLPPGFDPSRRYPLILEIHGGPHTSYGPSFATDMQLYAAAGYVVLYTNPRGSTSYGEAFANLIDKSYPGPDYDDLMAATDAAIARGFVDERNLFVTGGSGGGVLTAWIVGKTDRFRAAATQKPVVNWTSQALVSDIPTVVSGYWFEKTPWEDPEGYWRRSPLSLVGNVKTPTLVVVGEKDYRTPVAEAEQYYQALQLEGVPTALVVVPGASHGGLAARPSQSGAKAAAILAWFERYRVR
jgi:dipeptidyl aminopeptidase/acylaminoacyl peptidase